MKTVDTNTNAIRRQSHRRHSAQLKEQVLQACSEPGASVAVIARLHGLNANVVHRWRALQREMSKQAIEPALALPTPGFVAVAVQSEAAASCAPADIRIELRRGASAATVHWPVESAAACASWLSEWLR